VLEHETLAKAGEPWLTTFANWRQTGPRKSYSVQRVTAPSFQGDDSLRFELRAGETWRNAAEKDTFRSEIATDDIARIKAVRWYRFAIMLPTNFPIEDNRLVLFQWHGSDKKVPGSVSRSPALALRYRNAVLSIILRHSSERITHDNDAPSLELLHSSDFQLGKWSEFVFESNWDYDDGGYVNVWWNGKQVVHYQGPVGYNNDRGPYVSFGLYRDASDKTYIAYFSEVRGGKTAREIGISPPLPSSAQ